MVGSVSFHQSGISSSPSSLNICLKYNALFESCVSAPSPVIDSNLTSSIIAIDVNLLTPDLYSNCSLPALDKYKCSEPIMFG